MNTKTDSLRLTRGGFLTALVLSMTGVMGILQGCGGSTPDSPSRTPYLGTWVTSTTNPLGKRLTFSSNSSFASYESDLSAGSWDISKSLFGLGIVFETTDDPRKEYQVVSVNDTTLVFKIGEVNVTFTKAPASFIAFPASITATHTVGGTACPQALGTITVTNTGTSSITVTIPAVAQLTFDKTSFTLAAGVSTTVNVGFDCSEVPPFSRTITLTTTVGATTVTKTVSVQLNAG